MTNTNRWWQFWIFNPYGNFNLKRQGKIDGKLSIPPWTSEEQPDFLRGLYHVTQTTLEALGEAWHKLDRHLKGAWVAATLHQQQAEKELAEAAESEEQAQQRHKEVHGRRLVVPESHGRMFWYWLMVTVVLVCEFPLNSIVFQQLGVSTHETWLMTGVVAAAMVGCAHFLGSQLHQPVQGRPLVVIWRVVLAAIPVVVIVYIAMLRRDNMQQQALTKMGPWELLGTNVAINLLIFCTVTYFSYKLHDPVVEAALKAMSERRLKARQVHLAEKATASARIDRQKGHQQMQQDATSWLPEVRRRAAVYRCAHIRVRPDRNQHSSSVPIWSNLEPDLAIPEDLKQLEWNINPTSDAATETAPNKRFSATAAR